MTGDAPPRWTASGFAPGQRIAGYLLEERIGQGGMAVVFRAVDERLNRRVALKVLDPALADNQVFRQRFIRESQAAAAVDDANIIPVYEAGQAAGVLFIAMRLVHGDVGSLVAADGPLLPGRAALIIAAVASALDAAHERGLVHRDVKPGNILLDARPGRPDQVYLSDFGISKAMAESSVLTQAGQFIGTVLYAAPEQFSDRPVDGRADQYALGCVAYELLSGAPPFRRSEVAAVIHAHLYQRPPWLSQLRPGLPTAVEPVFATVLAKDPADRYTSCGEFAAALGSALSLATGSTAFPSLPGRRQSGPPTLTAASAPPAPEPAHSQPLPTGRKPRRRGRRLALAWTGGGLAVAASAAAVITLAAPGSTPSTHPGRLAQSASVHSSSGVPVAASRASSPTVIATIPVGSQPLWVAVSPDGQHAYVANADSGTVSVIDTASDRVTATISVPGVSRVAITPDGRYAYVTACPNACDNVQGSVSVISTASNTIIATFTAGQGPFGVAISPDGRYAYVTDRESEAVSVISTASNSVIATIPVGIFPTCVAVSPDGQYAYVTNATTNDVSVISTATDTVTATIAAGSGAFSVAFAPDGQHAYIVNLDNDTVSVIDTASNAVVTTVAVGSRPFAVAFAPDGRYAYVTDANSNSVSVIGTANNTVTVTLPLVNPEGLAFAPDGHYAYITNRDANTITVVNTGTS